MPSGNQLRSGTRASNNGARAQRTNRASDANDANSGASPMHAERLKKLHAAMLRCRIVENLIPASARKYCACSNRESLVAGTAIHLRPEDFVAPTSSELFARLVQGASLEVIGASLKEELDREFAGGEDIRASAASTSLTQLHVAVGMALASKLQGRPAVTLCIVDGPADPADFWLEPVEFAARRQLAIVFVLVNGKAPTQRPEPRSKTHQIVPAIVVDGNDAVAVYRVAEECTRRARQGLGPSLIECMVEAGRDPILFMENYLQQRELSPEDWKENFVREFAREAESSLKKYFGRTRSA